MSDFPKYLTNHLNSLIIVLSSNTGCVQQEVVILTQTLERVAKVFRPRTQDLRQTAISAICTETKCSRAVANETLQFIESIVHAGRRSGYYMVLPTTKQLRSQAYRTFHQVIPHGRRTAIIGSAQAHIEDAVLDRSRGELSIYHDMRVDGQLSHCGVQVLVNQMS